MPKVLPDSISSFPVTLTASQLQDLIREAVESAVAPLQERLDRLEALQEVYHGPPPEEELYPSLREAWEVRRDIFRCLPLRVSAVEESLCALEMASKKEPQPLQKDRAEILRALIVANGGKMLAKDARQKMHLKKNQFSELLATCDFLTLEPYHRDSRKKVIILKSKSVQQNHELI